ncbi:MAG: beta-ketoacyl-[acyl-carrier-protein] synthase family protein [Alphaproteobacteria bacterium]|nr:beta-ketoacyl-[acyl-carrier-protein] synthase family protein [Alphaproteobacteria bacterium]
MTNQVAVTGLGCISALGPDVAAFWAGLSAGRSGIQALEFEGAEELHVKIGGQIKRFDASAHFSPAKLPFLDPFAQFALVAAREATKDAGLTAAELAGPRTAVILGTGIGGISTLTDAFRARFALGKRRIDAATIPKAMPNAATSHVAMEFGVNGPAFAICSACSSANHAMGLALGMVRSGMVDRAITGGTEANLNLANVNAWEALKVLTPDACRPFSRGRNGMSLGDGAGIVILERMDFARTRGAKIYAEMAGSGASSDAGDLLRPDPKGAGLAMRQALADGGLAPEDIDYINAHGTGTLLNDPVETAAIRLVFGGHADKLAVSSTKSMHGHALGAAGALEMVATVLALKHQVAPPTANWLERDPKCDLDYVPNEARAMPIRAAMSNSFAFGGLNAVLTVKRAG